MFDPEDKEEADRADARFAWISGSFLAGAGGGPLSALAGLLWGMLTAPLAEGGSRRKNSDQRRGW